MRRAVVCAALLCAALCGCGREASRWAWERRWLEAERLYDDGRADPSRYAEARAAYVGLREGAREEDRRGLELRLANILEGEGRFGEALRAYGALWEGGVRDEVGARAAYRAGALLVRLGARARGASVWEALVAAHPESGGAESALAGLRGLWAEEPREALRVCARLYDAVWWSSLGDNLLYWRARVLWGAGEVEAAEAGFVALLERHPWSGLRHEARWALAQMALEGGEEERGLRWLGALAEEQDASWQVGIYESELADDARFWRGLVLERRGDVEGAEVEFVRFLEDHPDSPLRDDARWNLAVLAGRRGAREEAASVCKELISVEPESRWASRCEGEGWASGALSRSGLLPLGGL